MTRNTWTKRALRLAAIALIAPAAAGCLSGRGHGGGDPSAYRAANLRPYSVGGQRYTPRVDPRFEEKGLASWYSYPARTRRTASGEWFDPSDMTAAHKTLPIPCIAEVTNLETGKKIKVRINDRGPFVRGRVIDLSRRAAEELGVLRAGTARVKVRFVGPARHATGPDVVMLAQAEPPPSPEG